MSALAQDRALAELTPKSLWCMMVAATRKWAAGVRDRAQPASPAWMAASLEVARTLNTGQSHILQLFQRLADGHVLVLHPNTGEMWMAMPFSKVPTGFRVVFGESAWWAN